MRRIDHLRVDVVLRSFFRRPIKATLPSSCRTITMGEMVSQQHAFTSAAPDRNGVFPVRNHCPCHRTSALPPCRSRVVVREWTFSHTLRVGRIGRAPQLLNPDNWHTGSQTPGHAGRNTGSAVHGRGPGTRLACRCRSATSMLISSWRRNSMILVDGCRQTELAQDREFDDGTKGPFIAAPTPTLAWRSPGSAIGGADHTRISPELSNIP